MKKNDLAEVKKMEIKTLREKVKKERKELIDLMMDKGISKLKDLKAMQKKRKNIAQVLTVIRQKEILLQLGGK